MKNRTLFTRSTFVFISIQIGRFLMKGENHCLINQGGDVLRFICIIPTGVE